MTKGRKIYLLIRRQYKIYINKGTKKYIFILNVTPIFLRVYFLFSLSLVGRVFWGDWNWNGKGRRKYNKWCFEQTDALECLITIQLLRTIKIDIYCLAFSKNITEFRILFGLLDFIKNHYTYLANQIYLYLYISARICISLDRFINKLKEKNLQVCRVLTKIYNPRVLVAQTQIKLKVQRDK